MSFDYDGKRDRWNGYDAEEYREVVENHKKLEEARKDVKKNMVKEKAPDQEDDGESSSEDEDEEQPQDEDVDDDSPMPVGGVSARNMMSQTDDIKTHPRWVKLPAADLESQRMEIRNHINVCLSFSK